ncbi:unnamed protein product [Phytophthora lilii]|uniref:Unnamed protein product n=1 Tax=Phytophthora lilii TaxID=2077276 RepID=A0A9W6TLK1_9STRA|nr:unnamed protein product [Phytophthora lilii]
MSQLAPAMTSKSAFDSKLRGSKISNEDYERVKWVWGYYGMKTIKDLLVWYNNLDVVPFIKAIKSQRELFKRFDLDMFVDGVSLPGLSEKVMYQTCFDNLEYPTKKSANAFQFPPKRMSGYKRQDAEAKREFGMTLEHLNMLLKKQKYAKRNETKIYGGKICKKIIGYDANALYLWAPGNEMPCGRLTTIEAYDGFVDDIKNDKIFGFLECVFERQST